jgi:hypothetical protein
MRLMEPCAAIARSYHVRKWMVLMRQIHDVLPSGVILTYLYTTS